VRKSGSVSWQQNLTLESAALSFGVSSSPFQRSLVILEAFLIFIIQINQTVLTKFPLTLTFHIHKPMALSDTNRYVPKTSLWHYLIPTSMFQKQAYGTIRYQPVCSKNKPMALLWHQPICSKNKPMALPWHQTVCSKNKPMALPITNRYVPKTSLCHFLIPIGMFQIQGNGITLVPTSSSYWQLLSVRHTMSNVKSRHCTLHKAEMLYSTLWPDLLFTFLHCDQNIYKFQTIKKQFLSINRNSYQLFWVYVN